jgi:hypothetical protein
VQARGDERTAAELMDTAKIIDITYATGSQHLPITGTAFHLIQAIKIGTFAETDTVKAHDDERIRPMRAVVEQFIRSQPSTSVTIQRQGYFAAQTVRNRRKLL